jgi:hypothetical protein
VSETAERVDAPARGARARRIRIYWGAAWICGIVFMLASAILEFLVNRQLLAPSLRDPAVKEGLFAIGSGWVSLALWLQADYQRVSNAIQVVQPVGNQQVSALLSVIRRLITAILLAAPVVALIFLLTHDATGATYDQAAAVITLSSVANFLLITVAAIRSLLQHGKRAIR